MKKLNKGFTLIELLVVIAIIGILASVVLASLNSARTKGKDASAKTSITSVRAQSELFYNGPTANPVNSYAPDGVAQYDLNGIVSPATVGTDLAAGSTGSCSDPQNAVLMKAAAIQTGHTVTCTVANDGKSYVSEVELNDTTIFCVDSSGFAGIPALADGTPISEVDLPIQQTNGLDIACQHN